MWSLSGTCWDHLMSDHDRKPPRPHAVRGSLTLTGPEPHFLADLADDLPWSAVRLPGTHDIPGHIIGSIKNRMGKKVQVVISHDGRHIVYGIKGRVGNNAPQHQHREESRSLVLTEDTGDGNHEGEQGKDSEDHAGDHADAVKTCCAHGVAFHEILL